MLYQVLCQVIQGSTALITSRGDRHIWPWPYFLPSAYTLDLVIDYLAKHLSTELCASFETMFTLLTAGDM